MRLCDDVVKILDERTALRRRRVEEFNGRIGRHDVRLALVEQQLSKQFEEFSGRYGQGARIIGELRSRFSDRLAHLCLKRAYESALGGADVKIMFEHGEIGYFLNTFEEDDLRVELRVGKTGQEFSPIDQLSAGQRCTAVFPILLQLEEGPLIIDQPEDNLDNRHIATTIAPALIRDKRTRQMIFTSHNANLVVLTDAELIMALESDGSKGWLDVCGFLATRDSKITMPVLEIVDGGETALELRFRKYGRSGPRVRA